MPQPCGRFRKAPAPAWANEIKQDCLAELDKDSHSLLLEGRKERGRPKNFWHLSCNARGGHSENGVNTEKGGGERRLGITPTTLSDYCYCCPCFTCKVKNILIFSNFSYIIQSICTESQSPVVFFKPLCQEASAIVDDTTLPIVFETPHPWCLCHIQSDSYSLP